MTKWHPSLSLTSNYQHITSINNTRNYYQFVPLTPSLLPKSLIKLPLASNTTNATSRQWHTQQQHNTLKTTLLSEVVFSHHMRERERVTLETQQDTKVSWKKYMYYLYLRLKCFVQEFRTLVICNGPGNTVPGNGAATLWIGMCLQQCA